MARIIDGKAIAAKIRGELAEEVKKLAAAGIQPGLAVVLIGDDPASRVYVSMKEKACQDVGIFSDEYKLHAETSEADLLALIGRLNNDPRIHGILVQLPLPGNINTEKVLEAVSPTKDVDGFHPYNVGRLVIGKPLFRPCTPYGVMVMLKEAGIDLTGKEVVVVGRSNIVGKPVAFMCLQQHATVTLCHTRTRDLPAKVGMADVLIARCREAGDDQRRMDKGRRRGHRCGGKPGRRKKTGGRCGVRCSQSARFRHHPGAGGGRSHDHHHASP